MANFTPADVVAAYRAKGLKPLKNDDRLSEDPETGLLTVLGDRCCALGALGCGMRPPTGNDSWMSLIGHAAGLANPMHFGWGFDAQPDNQPRWSDPDYQLGRECRAAVAEAFGWDGYFFAEAPKP